MFSLFHHVFKKALSIIYSSLLFGKGKANTSFAICLCHDTDTVFDVIKKFGNTNENISSSDDLLCTCMMLTPKNGEIDYGKKFHF